MIINDLFNNKKFVDEAIGDLGSKRDQGKSIRKWRKSRGLDEQGGTEDPNGYNVVRYYEKTQEVKKLTNWLEKNAGLPKNSPLYFDDVDLVYGNKTIVPGALVDPTLTFNDLLTAVVQASKQGMAEATGDERFDTMMGQIQREPKYPDSQMPPTDVKDLYQWAVENNKLYHEIFAEWAMREGYKSVAPALQRAGDLDTEALDYWTPRVWKIYWGELNGIDSEMPPEWAKKRVPEELRDYLETVFEAYNRIVFDWPTEYRQIGQRGMAEAKKKKKSSRKFGGYFFPGYGYYGSGESGEGGGGGGESANRSMAEASLGDYRKKAQLSRAMAQTNRFFDRDDPAKVAAADQTMAKRERGMARADARVKPYTPPAQDAEKMQRDLTAKYPNIDELVAKAEQRRDPNYDRAEGNAYYDGREAEQNYQRLKQIQRVIQGLNESQASFKKNYLYEGLDRDGLQTVKLWESAGQRIVEAQLTIDQINQLFKSAEQDATAAGGNRTMLGKGKDAAMEVNQAWETLKDKVATSGPIKNMDAAYDTAADKLKQATGGDQGVMKYVQKYRDFAKKYPVAQSLIYSALIAAAGISGAGLGGAAALGLFKLVDKLLQGEKFSSAAYAGAKTGALAYGASKVADYFKGPQTPQSAGGDQIPGGGQITDPNAPDYNAGYAEYQRDIADVRGYDNYMTKNPTSSLNPEQYADRIGSSELMSKTKMMNDLASKMGLPPGAHQATFQGGVPVTIDGKAVPLDLLTQDQQRNIEAARAMRQAMSGSQSLAQKAAAAAAAPDKTYESREFHTSHKLTDADLYFIFSAATQLNEGVWDSIKGTASKYAGKAADWAKTQGTNLTTKVTADKLKSAWLKADSPTDSDQVYNVMIKAGVAPQILDTVYKTMNIPTFKEKALARPTTPAFSSAPIPAGPAPKPPAAAAPASATTTPASPEATPNAATPTTATAPATADAPKTKQLGTGTGRINPATGRPWTPSELKAKYAQPQPTAPTPDSEPLAPAPELTSPEPALKSRPPAPQSPEEIRKAKQSAAALAAQQAMGDVASPTPAPTVASTPAPVSSAATPSGPPAFNAGNLAQQPGMAQYTQPKTAAPKPAPNFARGPAGYKSSSFSVGPTADRAKSATAAATGKTPAELQQDYYRALGLAEDLSWSQNFNPGRSLYRRMKQES